MGTSNPNPNELRIEVQRIKARWLDWLNDPPPDGDYNAEVVRLLVETLDAYGRHHIRAVKDAASCDQFMRTIREAGSAIYQNARHSRELESFHRAIGATPTTERNGLPSEILGDAVLRFEARYAHWDAEALERSTSQPKPLVGSARERVSEFLKTVSTSARAEITRTMLWKAAGYTEATAFEDFQGDKPRASRTATANFERLLKLPPEEFLDLLKKKNLLK